MERTIFLCALICLTGVVSAQKYPALDQYPSQFYPVEHRNSLRSFQEVDDNVSNYEFQIVSRDQYDVAQYDATSTSFWELLPSTITTLTTTVGIKALSMISTLFFNAHWIALGAAIIVGFCAFTPYCTLTLETPFTTDLRALRHSIPYLDEVEDMFSRAYDRLYQLNQVK